MALGLDVEWEADDRCTPWLGGGGGYSQACTVHGDVLVGAERFALDGHGTRVHLWGPRPRGGPAGWAAGRMDDGQAFLVTDPEVECDDDGRLRSLRLGERTGTAVAHAPVLIPGQGRLSRALCRYESLDDAGRGHGWAEWFHPLGGSGDLA